MNFGSLLFIFGFLPVVILINLVMQEKYRKYWLLLTSIVFFAWAQPYYLDILAAVGILDYVSGLLIEKVPEKLKKPVMILAVLASTAILFKYKYFNFVSGMISKLIGREAVVLTSIMPIGVSFFTFKSISYIADVYTKKIQAERNPIFVFTYLFMFPSIMSGPIDRYGDISVSLKSQVTTVDDVVRGIERFTYGLAEKAVIANTLGLMVDQIWASGAGSNSAAVAWLGSIAYSLQLYFDFAGYSHMAIGIGKMMGLHLAENFDLPYISKSIAEFWRRWDMTLGSWFRNYIYIPLGGNRSHVYLNTAVVFLATGLWHGAGWSFILWGLYHGFFVIAERMKRSILKKTGRRSRSIPVLSHLYVLLAVNFGWVLFRAPVLKDALSYFGSMFGQISGQPAGLSLAFYLNPWNAFVLITAILLASGLPQKGVQMLESRVDENIYTTLKHILCLLLLLFSVMRLIMSTYSSFIYFQF